MSARVLLILPCLNEEEGLPIVLRALPPVDGGLRVVVVDNGCTDGSARVAREYGAEVVEEPERGYGAACLRGMSERRGEDIIAFVDADGSDHAEELASILAPLDEGRADLVIGSRMRIAESRRALLPQSRYGNRLAAFLLRNFFGLRDCTDLGPFRAMRASKLLALGMCDRNYGWTVEMQARAASSGLRVVEVPVRYRQRRGVSKITGTLRGTLGASWKILWTIFRLRLTLRSPRRRAATD